MNGLSFWLGFRALGMDSPFSVALFLQGVIALGVAVPSSPGFFGVFEVGAILGLGVYGVSRSEAVSWAIGEHVLSFIPITVIGAWYFARMGMHFRDIRRAETDPSPADAVPDAAPPRGIEPA
jgi:uncharacterized membrane protein YbhN (UPF0104 family)